MKGISSSAGTSGLEKMLSLEIFGGMSDSERISGSEAISGSVGLRGLRKLAWIEL